MIERVFGSGAFFRLWLAQVVSATGDWLGFLAIAALALRVGVGDSGDVGAAAGGAVGVVLAARLVPGFFLAPWAGVLADRLDRTRLMVVCDLGRAAVLVSLPFVDTLVGLVVASFVLELFTLVWAPAKEASVPHLVPADKLGAANSLSLVAAYGTIPIAAGVFAALATVANWFGTTGWVETLRLNQEGLAFYVDAASFVLTALIVWSLHLPRGPALASGDGDTSPGRAFLELKEGWGTIVRDPVVRGVNLGLGAGLLGGAMLVPLGPVFAAEALGAVTDAAYGLLVFALGCGVALGVMLLAVGEERLGSRGAFGGAVVSAGVAMLLAATTSSLRFTIPFIVVLGACAGAVYVLGLTLLHRHVSDDLRGRVFGSLFTLVRLCVLLAFVVAPLLAAGMSAIGEPRVSAGPLSVELLGSRVALWFGGVITVAAGVGAWRSLGALGRPDDQERVD